MLWRTRLGLRLRSVGEAPYAAESLGVNVYWYKYVAVMISGALAGLAGAFLVVGLKFQDGQTGGRGFIGLAAMIFGNWRPGGMAWAPGFSATPTGCSCTTRPGPPCTPSSDPGRASPWSVVAVLQYPRRAHGRSPRWPPSSRRSACGGSSPPTSCRRELVKAAPYAITLLVMGLASQNLRMPKADGLIYRKGGH